MTRDEIIRMAREAGLHLATNRSWMPIIGIEYAEKLIAIAAAAEREKVAKWMIQRSYATGHGDTIEDLLAELDWQIKERIAIEHDKFCSDLRALHDVYSLQSVSAIRERGAP